LSSPDTWIFRTARGRVVPGSFPIGGEHGLGRDRWAIAGFGITRVLSYQVADAIRAGTLAVGLEKFESTPWPISFVYSGQGSSGSSCGHFSISRHRG
jgi:hypothetical protein